jgi:hypothetical protein
VSRGCTDCYLHICDTFLIMIWKLTTWEWWQVNLTWPSSRNTCWFVWRAFNGQRKLRSIRTLFEPLFAQPHAPRTTWWPTVDDASRFAPAVSSRLRISLTLRAAQWLVEEYSTADEAHGDSLWLGEVADGRIFVNSQNQGQRRNAAKDLTSLPPNGVLVNAQ